ncbi:hypothetical protein [Lentzea sp. NPDC055074]
MRTGYKVALYTTTLAVIFGGTWAAGAAAPRPPAPSAAHDEAPAHGDTHSGNEAKVPPGLSTSDNGYTLRLIDNSRLAFRIEDRDGTPVTGFDVEHEKRLHLVLVRRDGKNFQHVHPEMAPDGTWSIPATLPEAGSYKIFADFKPHNGPKTVLSTDVQEPGDYRPATHQDSRTFTVDGYEVTLQGDLTTTKASTLTAEVTKNGTKVTTLQNYLGAKGHLVALRASDLAYLHVHPEQGDQVKFAVEVPTPGRYRLFLDFRHEDEVRTAEFTLTTHEEGGHGH